MLLFAQQAGNVLPFRAVEKKRREANHFLVELRHARDNSACIGGDDIAVRSLEIDTITDSHVGRSSEIHLDPAAKMRGCHDLGNVVHDVFARAGNGNTCHECEHQGSRKQSLHSKPPLNLSSQSGALLAQDQASDQELDHFTPFGARAPVPIAVPPRRAARISYRQLALIWLGLSIALSGSVYVAGMRLSELDRQIELAGRV